MMFGMQSSVMAETYQAWSDGSFAAANGEGTLTMAGHGGAKDYAANITGSVESSQFVISVPSVMGGTTITVTLGDMPAAAFTYATVTVTANEDGSYTLAGEGTCAMPSMQGGVKNYASDFKGTVKDGVLTAELAVPAVMGGVTVMFNPADFEEVMLTAGVKTISTANTDAPVYDLKGRRVGTNYKGIVIKNGKKYYQK